MSLTNALKMVVIFTVTKEPLPGHTSNSGITNASRPLMTFDRGTMTLRAFKELINEFGPDQDQNKTFISFMGLSGLVAFKNAD
jgi:hypothetical protein